MKNIRIVPSFCANVTENSGLVPYLDFVAEIAPSPEEAIETAKKLLQNKIPLEIILESTGISNETLQFLVKEMDENTY